MALLMPHETVPELKGCRYGVPSYIGLEASDGVWIASSHVDSVEQKSLYHNTVRRNIPASTSPSLPS